MAFLSTFALPTAHRKSWSPSGLLPSSPGQCPPALDEDRDGLSTDDEDPDSVSGPNNPLKYFLTPVDSVDDDLEFEFDFDAGIEDSNSPRDTIRCVSPSTLDGLRRYRSKQKEASCAIIDDGDDDSSDNDDDDEEYIRFSPDKPLPLSMEDSFDHPRHKFSHGAMSRTTEALLSPPSFHIGSPSGRYTKRLRTMSRRSGRGRPVASPIQRRHSWREPSPDVWSIEEEPEEESRSEMAQTKSLDDLKKTQPIDIPASKPGKKVRFMLPLQEL